MAIPPPETAAILDPEIAEHLAQATEHMRAVLSLLPPLAEGPARIALEQITRARQISAAGTEVPVSLEMLPLPDLAEVIKRRREAAGLSQLRLAERAGLAPKTIRNLEAASHRPSRDTLGRLLAVAELGLIATDLLSTDEGAERPNSWLLPRYDRKRMIDDMIEILNSPGGALEQTCLYLDDQSAADWMELSGSQAFMAAFRAMPLDRAAERIAAAVGGHGLDVNAIGSGDARNEVRLIEELCARRGGTDLRLHLLDISHSLLTAAYQHARDRLDAYGVQIATLHGDFHQMARYGMLLPRPETINRRRVYLMLGGTLANLDNEVVFFRDALSLAAPGDLCLLDFQIAYASPEKPDEIRRLDPPLVHGTPEGHKRWFAGPVRRYCQNLKHFEGGVELNVQCPIRGSYELNCFVQVERGNGRSQRYFLYRVRRYDPTELQRCLEGLGWRQLLMLTYGPNDRAGIMLLERKLIADAF
jgi:transcriptional regulator with XRE-family HTH domain